MTLSLRCPGCDKPVTLPVAARGKAIRCLSCKQAFRVPEDAPADASQAGDPGGPAAHAGHEEVAAAAGDRSLPEWLTECPPPPTSRPLVPSWLAALPDAESVPPAVAGPPPAAPPHLSAGPAAPVRASTGSTLPAWMTDTALSEGPSPAPAPVPHVPVRSAPSRPLTPIPAPTASPRDALPPVPPPPRDSTPSAAPASPRIEPLAPLPEEGPLLTFRARVRKDSRRLLQGSLQGEVTPRGLCFRQGKTVVLSLPVGTPAEYTEDDSLLVNLEGRKIELTVHGWNLYRQRAGQDLCLFLRGEVPPPSR